MVHPTVNLGRGMLLGHCWPVRSWMMLLGINVTLVSFIVAVKLAIQDLSSTRSLFRLASPTLGASGKKRKSSCLWAQGFGASPKLISVPLPNVPLLAACGLWLLCHIAIFGYIWGLQLHLVQVVIGLVCCTPDHASQELQLPYGQERQCGRALTTCHYVRDQPIVTATVYGYPAGPTWPNARELTGKLLECLSIHLVLGGHGPRLIGGDFNLPEDGLPCFQLWRNLGWMSAQTFAAQTWGQQVKPTCKHKTERDFVWLSPEAQAMCRYVDVADLFADHAMVTVGLGFEAEVDPPLQWPLPSKIPWDQVSDSWHSSAMPPLWLDDAPADVRWSQLGASLEAELDGQLPSQPGESLQPSQRGRLQQVRPRARPGGRPFLEVHSYSKSGSIPPRDAKLDFHVISGT